MSDERGWGYSTDDGESYFGPFPSRKAAIADAMRERNAGDPIAEIVLGRCNPVTFEKSLLSAIDVRWMLEQAEENAPDFDEAAPDDSVFTQGPGARQALREALENAAREWLRQYPCRPYFNADEVERLTLEVAEDSRR